jgi:transaldolase
MKIFIDTANLEEIKKAKDLGIIDGVTTNPSLLAKEKENSKELLEEICKLVKGPVSAGVLSLTENEMVKEGLELSDIASNIVIKLPITNEGLRALSRLKVNDVKTNLTLCFSATQALLVAKVGATYVSPFVGRLDDIGIDGIGLIRDIKQIYTNYNYGTQIIVASIRNLNHIIESAKIGADIATIPYKVIEQMIKHKLTDVGIEKFLADYRNKK